MTAPRVSQCTRAPTQARLVVLVVFVVSVETVTASRAAAVGAGGALRVTLGPLGRTQALHWKDTFTCGRRYYIRPRYVLK